MKGKAFRRLCPPNRLLYESISQKHGSYPLLSFVSRGLLLRGHRELMHMLLQTRSSSLSRRSITLSKDNNKSANDTTSQFAFTARSALGN